MNKADFLNLIGSDTKIDRQILAELSELVNIFPYFQTAHLLYLKGLKDNQDIRFENQLRNSAIHIADREVLYNLLTIKQETDIADEERFIPPEATAITEDKVETAIIPEVIPAEVSGPPVEVGQTIEAEEVVTDSFQVDIGQTVISGARNSEDLINEIEKDSEESPELNRQEIYGQYDGRPILIADDTEIDGPVPGVFIINEETDDLEEKVFYMDPGFSVPESESDDVTQQMTEIIRHEEPAFDSVESESDEQITEETKIISTTRKEQADLIDKFIMANPRIEPRKEKSDQPVEDLADRFTEESGGFVTETLARIYISQGYYSKAIDIYQKLSLKFPEKSDYFATQIEKIKKILK